MQEIVMEQQIYSSGDRGFMTLAASKGISGEERIELERKSIYQLPASKIYDPDASRPEKLVFYALGESRFVIGKAIDFGKDRLGRLGNYLFHNLVINKADLVAAGFNPPRLTRALLAKDLFAVSLPDREAMDVVRLPLRDLRPHAVSGLAIKSNLSLALFHACVDATGARGAVLVRGSSEELLDFLEWLFAFMPYPVRERLSYDTYAHDVPPGFTIVGLPKGDAYRSNGLHSIIIDLSEGVYELRMEQPKASALAGYMAELASTGRIDEAEAFFNLQNTLRAGNFHLFETAFAAAPVYARSMLIDFHKSEILRALAAGHCRSVLPYLAKNLRVEDIAFLADDPRMLGELAAMEDGGVNNAISAWFLGSRMREKDYAVLFGSLSLWRTFLARMRDTASDRYEKLVELMQAMRHHYSAELEGELYNFLFGSLVSMGSNRKKAVSVARAMELLPQPPGGREGEMLQLLRNGVILALSGDSHRLELFLRRDYSWLPAVYARSLDEIVLKEAFDSCQEKALLNAVFGLFRRSKDKTAFFERLISLKVPRRAEGSKWAIAERLLESVPLDTKDYRDMSRLMARARPGANQSRLRMISLFSRRGEK